MFLVQGLPLIILLRAFLLPVDARMSRDSSLCESQSTRSLVLASRRNELGWVTDRITKLVDLFLPNSRSCDTIEGRLKKKKKKKKFKLNKYVLPLIVGFLLIVSILLPIALNALAVLSGKAVILSVMSLILAAIVGLKKVAQSSHGSSKYRRNDENDLPEEIADNEAYRFYRDRRRKK